jgi:fructose-specific phosphotransferase system IIA component
VYKISIVYNKRWLAMKLTEIMQPNLVKVPLEGPDKESVIAELVDLLGSNGLLNDRAAVLEAVMKREQTRSTGIGSGIAVPHGKCDAVKELVMSMGVARKPIDFASVDGKGVTIVILLVSPLDRTGPHIQALAKISKLMLDKQFREAVEKAMSAEELYELISAKENE